MVAIGPGAGCCFWVFFGIEVKVWWFGTFRCWMSVNVWSVCLFIWDFQMVPACWGSVCLSRALAYLSIRLAILIRPWFGPQCLELSSILSELQYCSNLLPFRYTIRRSLCPEPPHQISCLVHVSSTYFRLLTYRSIDHFSLLVEPVSDILKPNRSSSRQVCDRITFCIFTSYVFVFILEFGYN